MKFCAKKLIDVIQETYYCSKLPLYVCVLMASWYTSPRLQVSITGNTEPSIQVETLVAENKIIISDASGVVLQQIDYTFPSNQDPSFLVYGNPSESIIREKYRQFFMD